MREVGYHPHSGLCRVHGQEVLLIDWDLAPDLQIELLAGVLEDHDLAGIELSEDARRVLGRLETRRAS